MTRKQWIKWSVLMLLGAGIGAAVYGVLTFRRIVHTSTLCPVMAGILTTHAEQVFDQGGTVSLEELKAFARTIQPPGNSKGLVYTDDTGAPLDPWGNKLVISIRRKAEELTIEVRSSGWDGVVNTADDFVGERTMSLSKPVQ